MKLKPVLISLALGLAAVWISNNVSFAKKLTDPRPNGPVV